MSIVLGQTLIQQLIFRFRVLRFRGKVSTTHGLELCSFCTNPFCTDGLTLFCFLGTRLHCIAAPRREAPTRACRWARAPQPASPLRRASRLRSAPAPRRLSSVPRRSATPRRPDSPHRLAAALDRGSAPRRAPSTAAGRSGPAARSALTTAGPVAPPCRVPA